MSNNQAVSFLDVNLLAVAGIVLLVDLIVFARTFRKISVVAMVDTLERTAGLAIPEELRSSIGRHLLRRQRIRLAFIFFTTIAMVVVVFTVSLPSRKRAQSAWTTTLHRGSVEVRALSLGFQ
ncbi:MAG: hypothetical protein KF739_09495 [Cryobacterium sp.]|nr:hypothetical protein [Cryobacterium sp.]HNP16316.1 hypothetical protein [Terrimesophilobacter sp.]